MKRVFSVPGKSHANGRVRFKWQRKTCNYLATAGTARSVNIFDRNGKLFHNLELTGNCAGFDWSADGDILAVIQDKSPNVTLWDANTATATKLDTGLKSNLTFVSWSATGSLLSIGTAKGNLLLYNSRTSRKVPILGKHSEAIHDGVWGPDNMLCLASNDRSISLSNSDGDTLQQPILHGDPSDVRVFTAHGSTKVSVLLNKSTLYLLNLADPDAPIELAFQSRYGNIVSYHWFGQGRIMIGFTSGHFVVVSTKMSQIGQELFQSRNHKNRLNDVACSTTLGKAATCGDDCIKIHDLNDLTDMYAIIKLEDDRGMLDTLSWSDDGQLLSVSTQDGKLYTYLTKLPVVGDANATQLAYLTNLQEITVCDPVVNPSRKIKAKIPVEPSVVGVSDTYAVCAMNDRAWFYTLGDEQADLLLEKSYVGSVRAIKMNEEYAAALCDGRVQLHLITDTPDEATSKLFPESGEKNITSVALTNSFCIYGTESGGIHYFLLEDLQFVNEFKHVVGVRSLVPDANGTRLLCLDDKGDGFVYNPVNDAILDIPGLSPSTKGFLWDQQPSDYCCFVAFDEEHAYTYVYKPVHIRKPQCVKLSKTKLPYLVIPLMLNGGTLVCLTQSGKTMDVVLESHSKANVDDVVDEDLQACAEQNTALGRFRQATAAATKLKDQAAWKKLAQATIESLDIPSAITVHRGMGDAATVNALRQIQSVEDKSLLAGHMSVLLGNFQEAQDAFLSSSSPIEALNMHRDLLHWEEALKLASRLKPDEIPYISREHAQQLEFSGHHSQALSMYENGITKKSSDEAHNAACKAGMARALLRTGDLRRGMTLASELNSRPLERECAEILEGMGQLNEAASLYQQAQQYERAAAVYIRSKNWPQVGEMLQHVSTPKLHGQYAKAREAGGSYKEAAVAYETAKDYLSVIRVNLEHLRNPDEAVRVVKETGSIEGAKMVARFFQNLGDFESAIQFLVMSQCQDEALTLAKEHGKMDIYAQVVGDGANTDDYSSIATHFESSGNHLEAGRFFAKSGQHAKALKHLLQSKNEDGQHIDVAIEVVGASKDEGLTRQLVDYLLGKSDGTPKNAKYLFKLHMALQKYRDAAQTAIIIAREEQTAGNYRNAHDVLFSMYRQLQKEQIPIPMEMRENLMILHSYIIVKLHVARGDNTKAARMLIRVANHISKFPSHVVNILTSTVIKCHKSGLKNSSFSYAAMLMRPEYANQVDQKYKKKIEGIVRKRDKTEEPEAESPCPYCDTAVQETQLQCSGGCENVLPYCIASGFHMTKAGWSECPECHFPAIYSEFAALLQVEPSCPMCTEPLTPDRIMQIPDPDAVLQRYKHAYEGEATLTADTAKEEDLAYE
eukprot:m.20040 g.20040  ORF g.20040 m.20040 type:complete len:1352 (-) comp6065_c0_seq2:172-4227(-)